VCLLGKFPHSRTITSKLRRGIFRLDAICLPNNGVLTGSVERQTLWPGVQHLSTLNHHIRISHVITTGVTQPVFLWKIVNEQHPKVPIEPTVRQGITKMTGIVMPLTTSNRRRKPLNNQLLEVNQKV
jgi:hypothetical protein